MQLRCRHHAAHDWSPITPRDAESGDAANHSPHANRTFENIHRRILDKQPKPTKRTKNNGRGRQKQQQEKKKRFDTRCVSPFERTRIKNIYFALSETAICSLCTAAGDVFHNGLVRLFDFTAVLNKASSFKLFSSCQNLQHMNAERCGWWALAVQDAKSWWGCVRALNRSSMPAIGNRCGLCG